MSGLPEEDADRADIATPMSGLLAWMDQGRTSERTLFVVVTQDPTVIYAAESRAFSGLDENPEPEQEAEA